MNSFSLGWSPEHAWQPAEAAWPGRADLVLGFGAREILAQPDGPWAALVRRYPSAVCAACSTAGEILGRRVSDRSLAVLVVSFAGASVRAASIDVPGPEASYACAADLGRRLAAPDLRHVLVLSDGLVVNGSALADGFWATLPPEVGVTGGLAGDGTDFKHTVAGLGGALAARRIVAVGFYGARLRVSHGFGGGWTPFGPRRLVTRAEANVLYSLDDQPALALYKRYLGERAAGLPATGLLFPLQLLPDREAGDGLVRTILAVDEAAQSLTFAGVIPTGRYVRLMRASGDALIDGAGEAAGRAAPSGGAADRFAVLVSCVGRRLVLGQRVEDEIEAVLATLGDGVAAAGFYSYGELAPGGRTVRCDLHNQTMTLTVFAEAD